MSTRCRIGKVNNDGTVTSIYCHHDGYLSFVGKVLLEHYTDEETVNKLIALGDMSALGKTPVATTNFDYEKCETYRALGEKNCDQITCDNKVEYFKNIDDLDYMYLFEDGTWCYRKFSSEDILPLTIECCKK